MDVKIAIMTGSLPPDACGVGDYTDRLVHQLRSEGACINIFYRRDWSLLRMQAYLCQVKSLGAEVVNIQYPTEGYGYSILPHLLCAVLRGSKRVVTLHEFSRKSLKGRCAIYLFFLFADQVIFTNEQDRQTACRVAPWLSRKSSVVPIASNIPMHHHSTPEIDIVYFGLIRPLKGIETFIEVVSTLLSRVDIKVSVVGQTVAGYEQYAANILQSLETQGVELCLNRSAEEVAVRLGKSRIALLPFPDGLSLRRGSALAAMGNGALLVTTPPASESDEVGRVCVTAKSTDEFCRTILDILEKPESYESIRSAGEQFARARSWKSIATSYLGVFALES